MDKPVKCFIVEGKERDYQFIKQLVSKFFNDRVEAITICLPAEQNIFMLYSKLSKDSFETDVIELLREESSQARKSLEGIDRQSIDEVYLFFDFDIHQKNLRKGQDPFEALNKMLRVFDNETENGKLYISYPMVEALYDYKDGKCEAYSECWYPVERIQRYKHESGLNNPNASCHFSKIEDWKKVLSVFGSRIQCFFQQDKLDYDWYRSQVTVESILNRQKKALEAIDSVFVLSAFPEFLFDYFKQSFFKQYLIRNHNKFKDCPHNSKARDRLID